MTPGTLFRGLSSSKNGEEISIKKTFTVRLFPNFDFFVDESRLEDIDAEIRKIDGEVRMLKRR